VPLAVFLAGPFMLPDEIEDRQGPNELLIRNRERIPPGSPVFSRPRLAHACAWYFKRQDIVLFDRVSEFEYGIANSPHPIARRVRAKRLARMVAAASPETLFTVVSEEKRFQELRPLLPAPCYLDSEGGNVLAQFKGGGGAACK